MGEEEIIETNNVGNYVQFMNCCGGIEAYSA